LLSVAAKENAPTMRGTARKIDAPDGNVMTGNKSACLNAAVIGSAMSFAVTAIKPVMAKVRLFGLQWKNYIRL
jgi:hypothetical protein